MQLRQRVGATRDPRPALARALGPGLGRVLARRALTCTEMRERGAGWARSDPGSCSPSSCYAEAQPCRLVAGRAALGGRRRLDARWVRRAGTSQSRVRSAGPPRPAPAPPPRDPPLPPPPGPPPPILPRAPGAPPSPLPPGDPAPSRSCPLPRCPVSRCPSRAPAPTHPGPHQPPPFDATCPRPGPPPRPASGPPRLAESGARDRSVLRVPILLSLVDCLLFESEMNIVSLKRAAWREDNRA